jgi:hypothetical protein
VEALLGGLIGGLIAAGATYLVARRQLEAQETELVRRALLEGLGHLTGGTQSRNVGVGIIESLLSNALVPSTMRRAAEDVLWNQLLYLSHKNQSEVLPPHERDNGMRMASLLDSHGYHPRSGDIGPAQIAALLRRGEA